MKQKYLKIENIGICPPECFTTLGVGFADTCVDPSKRDLIIGQFASGLKNSMCVLLRNNLSPTVFTSNLKMDFSTQTATIKDELNTKNFEKIIVKYSGKDVDGKTKSNTEVLSMTTDFGKLIWKDTSLALRELVSNAIDFCIRKFGNWNDVEVELVDENQVRAKAGSTRIFIPVNSDVMKFYCNLGKWFLHFSEAESLRKQVLPKNNRSFEESNKANIYRRGVFVRSFKSSDKVALFDYNLNSLAIDEARVADDWQCKHAAGVALAQCEDKKVLSIYMDGLKGEYWEHEFSDWSMQEINETAWKESFEAFHEGKVLCTADYVERIERKGYGVVAVPEALFKILEKAKIKTFRDVLSKNEAEGLTIVDASDEAVRTYNAIWKFLSRNHLTKHKEQCPINAFVGMMNGGATTLGFYRDDHIYVKNTLSGKELFKTIIEEVNHYVTGSTDCSTDFQEYLLDIIVSLNTEMSEITI